MRERSRNGSWSEDDFHQVGLAGVEALKRLRAILERSNGTDERLYLDGAAGKQLDGLRVFSGGGAGTLNANLASDSFLQRKSHFRSDVADERDGPALADGVDRGANGCVYADGFKGEVDAGAFGALENFGDQFVAGSVERLGGADFFGECQARRIDIRNKNGRTAGSTKRLETK